MNNGKPFLVLTFFMLLIALFAGAAIGNTDLTPNTPPADIVYTVPGTGDGAFNLVPIGDCGSTYMVRSGDTLSGIARNCGLTLKDVLSVNPGITNANYIRPGQKINLAYRVTVTPRPTATAAPTTAPGEPQINGLRPGGKILIEMDGFPAKSVVTVSLSPVGGEARSKAEAVTSASGKLKLRIDIPPSAKPGESWVVTVNTVNNPDVRITAEPFTIEK